MRNDDDCSTGHQSLECVLNFGFGAWVKIRCCFVKHKHCRVNECGTSKRNQLTLACR